METKSILSMDELTEMLGMDLGSLCEEASATVDTQRRRSAISMLAVGGAVAAEENPYLTINAEPVKVDPTEGYKPGKIIDHIKGMTKQELFRLMRDTALLFNRENSGGPHMTDYMVRAAGGKVIDHQYYFPIKDE